MCRLLIFWGNKEADLSHWLTNAENSLLKQSRCDESGRPNPDGWGIAWRSKNKIEVVKNIQPAFEDERFINTAKNLKSKLLFAHIRRRSQGRVSMENTHPFVHKNWLFIHNGNIPNLESHKQELNRNLPDEATIQTNGTTDSEFLFRYFHYWFSQNKNCGWECTLNIISSIIRQLIEFTPEQDQSMLALNFLLTNQKYLIGFRRNRKLFYTSLDKGILIASEKLDELCNWNEIPDNHFIISTHPGKIKLVAYDIELKQHQLNLF